MCEEISYFYSWLKWKNNILHVFCDSFVSTQRPNNRWCRHYHLLHLLSRNHIRGVAGLYIIILWTAMYTGETRFTSPPPPHTPQHSSFKVSNTYLFLELVAFALLSLKNYIKNLSMFRRKKSRRSCSSCRPTSGHWPQQLLLCLHHRAAWPAPLWALRSASCHLG